MLSSHSDTSGNLRGGRLEVRGALLVAGFRGVRRFIFITSRDLYPQSKVMLPRSMNPCCPAIGEFSAFLGGPRGSLFPSATSAPPRPLRLNRRPCQRKTPANAGKGSQNAHFNYPASPGLLTRFLEVIFKRRGRRGAEVAEKRARFFGTLHSAELDPVAKCRALSWRLRRIEASHRDALQRTLRRAPRAIRNARMCGFAEGFDRSFDFALINIRKKWKKLEILHSVQDDRWRALPRHSRGSSSHKNSRRRRVWVLIGDTSGAADLLERSFCVLPATGLLISPRGTTRECSETYS